MKKQSTNYLLIFLTTLIVSSTEVALKLIGHAAISGLQLNFWRFLIGGLFLLSLTKQKKIALKSLPRMLVLAFLFIVLSMTFYQLAIEQSNAFFVAVVFSLNPLFARVVDALSGNNSFRSLLVMLTSLIGLSFIVIPAATNNFIGIFYAIVASMLFGIYSWLNIRIGTTNSTLTNTAYTFIFGAFELYGIVIISHKLSPYSKIFEYFNLRILTGIDWENITSLLFLSIIVTAGGFFLYFICQRRYPEVAHLIFFSKPAVSVIFSILLLGEEVTMYSILGIFIIITSNLITLRRSLKS